MGGDRSKSRQEQEELAESESAERRAAESLAEGELSAVAKTRDRAGISEATSGAGGRSRAVAAATARHCLAVEAGFEQDDGPYASELVRVEVHRVKTGEGFAKPVDLDGQRETLRARWQKSRRVEARQHLSRREEEQLSPGRLQQGQLVLHRQPRARCQVASPTNVQEQQLGRVLADRLGAYHRHYRYRRNSRDVGGNLLNKIDDD